MPSTPAQKLAAKKWRENNREKHRQQIKEWTAANYEKQKAYARKSMAKHYAWKCACAELLQCLA